MGQIATQSAFAAALLDPAMPVPNGVTTFRGDADASRFAVYRNNVFVGLVRALEKVFPVTRRLVGDDFFAGMARAYAATERPRSPLLFVYGATFSEFIGGFAPARGLAYLADVAKLEFARLSAYHARDAEPLALAAFGAVAPDRLGGLRLNPHPAARLLASQYPAGSICLAHQRETVTPIEDWSPQTLLVARPLLDVSIHILRPADAPFATALFAGATLSDAAAGATDEDFDFGAALVRLTALGAFETILED